MLSIESCAVFTNLLCGLKQEFHCSVSVHSETSPDKRRGSLLILTVHQTNPISPPRPHQLKYSHDVRGYPQQLRHSPDRQVASQPLLHPDAPSPGGSRAGETGVGEKRGGSHPQRISSNISQFPAPPGTLITSAPGAGGRGNVDGVWRPSPGHGRRSLSAPPLAVYPAGSVPPSAPFLQ